MFDDQYSKSYKTCFGKDAINKFLNDMIRESEYCSKIMETEFNKPFVVTERDNEDFENSTKSKCWIFKKEYGEGEVKVEDHDHITGKY